MSLRMKMWLLAVLTAIAAIGADGYAGGDDGDHESCERNGEARSTHSFSSHGQGW